MMNQRRICWPTPDATCLEGGCGWCNYRPWRNISQIERYAANAGQVPNRGNNDTKDAWEAYKWGWNRGFCNADVRYKAPPVPK